MKLRWSDVAVACPALAQSGTALDREQAMHRAHALAAEEHGRPLGEHQREEVALLAAALHAEALGQDPCAYGLATPRGPADRVAPAPRAQSELEQLHARFDRAWAERAQEHAQALEALRAERDNARRAAAQEVAEAVAILRGELAQAQKRAEAATDSHAAVSAERDELLARAEAAERRLAELEAQRATPAAEPVPAEVSPAAEGAPASESAPRGRRR